MVDGPGFRTSIYCAGCRHACPGCHNPQSWDFSGGHPMSTEQIMRIIEADPYANVTFSGGDPMYQPEGFAELARAIRERTDKDIWCFTGFTYETLLHNPRQRQLLELIDVLVDGPQQLFYLLLYLVRLPVTGNHLTLAIDHHHSGYRIES